MPKPEDRTYYLSRNTNCHGELSPLIEVWYVKPIRLKLAFDKGYVWQAPIGEDAGLYGSFSLISAKAWYKTIPDNDSELIKVEMRV